MCPLKDITDTLAGCRYRKEDVAAVLERFDLTLYFGSISHDEVIETMFENAAGS